MLAMNTAVSVLMAGTMGGGGLKGSVTVGEMTGFFTMCLIRV
jgi:hypothetical protein